ncbi:706_t:CDS:2 [Ambispora gerdemannii]|uniref:706_t:CDS:1 n=1 Tax=Ambispora gerdemannii TaxID=144530 RepID=A0A9N9GI77_9GLOM|nr:706_t:CDS:2 [Ambispora gerdemannii]
MATYKQNPIRIQRHLASSDSEENSASEWFVFGARTAKREPRPVQLSRNNTTNTVSEDDEWHMLSDETSPVDENSSVLEGISDVSSSGSGFNSEVEVVVNESHDIVQRSPTPIRFTRLMPSHDGTGDFSNPTESNVSISHPNSSMPNSLHGKINSKRRESVGSNEQSKDNSSRRSGIFKNELTTLTLRVLEDPNLACQDRTSWNNFPKTEPISSSAAASSSAKSTIITTTNNNASSSRGNSLNYANSRRPSFTPLFDLSVSVPSGRNHEHHDTRYSEHNSPNISRLANNIMNSREALSINFLPTIDKGTFNEILTNKNEIPSILSAVWMSFCRFTSNIINADVELYNDISLATARSLESSNNNFGGGLASIIAETGENRYTYDACYLPFGNHLTFTDLGYFPLGERDNIFSHKHQSNVNTKSEGNLNRIRARNFFNRCDNTGSDCGSESRLKPRSRSLSLRNFFNRRNSSGSDCGLENARVVSNTIEHPVYEQECI